MFDKLKANLRARAVRWLKISERQGDSGFVRPDPGTIHSSRHAESLTAYFAARRKYMTTIAALPLITYRRLDEGGREKATDRPEYKILNYRPNPAMNRHVLMQGLVAALFDDGEWFAQLQWAANGRLLNILPVPACEVINVNVNAKWEKSYVVRVNGAEETFQDFEMLHVYYDPDPDQKNMRGRPMWEVACETLGLHRQVMESATAFYRNASRPAGYLKHNLIGTAKDEFKKEWYDDYAGPSNAGRMPFVPHNVSLEKFPTSTAEDAKIVEALGLSVGDVGRITNLTPAQLGDLTGMHYNSLSADNAAVYQKSFMPMLDCITTEWNNKIFGGGADVFCDFLVQSILEGDPVQQADVATKLIQAGVLTRAEQRAFMNLPPIEGLDTPLFPLNQGPELANESNNGGPQNDGSNDPESTGATDSPDNQG